MVQVVIWKGIRRLKLRNISVYGQLNVPEIKHLLLKVKFLWYYSEKEIKMDCKLCRAIHSIQRTFQSKRIVLKYNGNYNNKSRMLYSLQLSWYF